MVEIQSSSEFFEGKLKNWAWVPGSENPADWCTKPRTASDIGNKLYYSGPEFLEYEEEKWPIRHSYCTDKLEGEMEKPVFCGYIHTTFPDIIGRLIDRSSRWIRMIRVMAWIVRFGSSLKAPLESVEFNHVKLIIVKYAQQEIYSELSEAADKGTGRYRKLAPVLDAEGVWRVGSRMRSKVPFIVDSKMPKILPTKHKVTMLIMRFCHRFSHAGHDGTLCRFRAQGFW